MTRAEHKAHAARCEAILAALLDRTNRGEPVAFERDWGGNSLTLFVGRAHTHVGFSDGTWPQLIEELHGQLCEGRGLSWVGESK